MKDKELLKQIEQACLNNLIDYRDLIDLGIDLQRRKQDVLAEQIEKIRLKNSPADPIQVNSCIPFPKISLN